MDELMVRKDRYLRMMEEIPAQGYLTPALGAIAASALISCRTSGVVSPEMSANSSSRERSSLLGRIMPPWGA